MVDVFPPEMRSQIMSRVKSKNTRPELRVRRALHQMGYRFRLHSERVPGRPDIFLRKHKTAVFVHGCFWHGHEGCKRSKLPTTRADFWKNKIEKNRARDQRIYSELACGGLHCVIIWECEIKDEDALQKYLDQAIGGEKL